MTIVGKIMVFVVLICSLVQGAFAVMVYTARTQWSAQYTDLSAKYKVAQANADTWAVQAKKAETDADARVAATKPKVDKLEAETATQKRDISDRDATIVQLKLEQEKDRATVKAVQADIQRRQADVEQVRLSMADLRKEFEKIIETNNDLRKDRVTAEIQARTFKDRSESLEAKLQDLAKELARKNSPLAGGGKPGTTKNPPPENIEGLVRQTGGDLVTITLGSDAGLTKGNTLEVFRLSNIPDQSKYIGTIRIIEVRATEAVGQPMGRMAAPMQVGDRVASRITGG